MSVGIAALFKWVAEATLVGPLLPHPTTLTVEPEVFDHSEFGNMLFGIAPRPHTKTLLE